MVKVSTSTITIAPGLLHAHMVELTLVRVMVSRVKKLFQGLEREERKDIIQIRMAVCVCACCCRV